MVSNKIISVKHIIQDKSYFEKKDVASIWSGAHKYPLKPELNHFVIIAGGKATRMKKGGFFLPKPLYPINNEDTLLSNIVNQIEELTTNNIKMVVRPDDYDVIASYIEKNNIEGIELVTMGPSKGHGDGARYGVESIGEKKGNVIFLWCDMFYRKETLNKAIRLHNSFGQSLTMPTVTLDKPYAAIDRNREGSVKGFLFQSDGVQMPQKGEDNIGIFIFDIEKANKFIQTLDGSIWDGQAERKVDDLLKLAAQQEEVFAPRIGSDSDYQNINSPKDSREVQK